MLGETALAVSGVPPSVEVHVVVYDEIAGPFAAGGVIVTRIVFMPATVTNGSVGVAGAPSTRVGVDVVEFGPRPAAFELAAVQEYAIPSVRPETMTGLVPVVDWVAPPGSVHVTSVESILAPLLAPSVNATLTAFAPPVVTPVMVGAPGILAEMNDLVASVGLLVASSFETVPEHV